MTDHKGKAKVHMILRKVEIEFTVQPGLQGLQKHTHKNRPVVNLFNQQGCFVLCLAPHCYNDI